MSYLSYLWFEEFWWMIRWIRWFAEVLARLNLLRDLLIQHHRDQGLEMPTKVCNNPKSDYWCIKRHTTVTLCISYIYIYVHTDIWKIYQTYVYVLFAVTIFSRSDLSKSRDPVSSGGNGCIFAEANGGSYLYEQADSWLSWDFPWFSMDWKVPKSLSRVWVVGDIVTKAFCEKAESIVFEFNLGLRNSDTCGILWASFTVTFAKVFASCIKQSLSSTETLSIRRLIFSFLFFPSQKMKIESAEYTPWDRIKPQILQAQSDSLQNPACVHRIWVISDGGP